MAFSTFSVVQPQPLSTSKTFSTPQEETWYWWNNFKGYCHKAVKVGWGRNQSPPPALLNTSKWAIKNVPVIVVYSQDGLRFCLAGEL